VPYSDVGGKLKPLERLDLVRRYAVPESMENAKVVHGRRISHLRTAQEPAPGDGEILRDILVSQIQLAQRVERMGRVFLRGALQPGHRSIAIHARSHTVAIDPSELELSFNLALLRRFGEPSQRGNMVGREDDPELRRCGGISLFRQRGE
jgi:hypothetical protein